MPDANSGSLGYQLLLQLFLIIVNAFFLLLQKSPSFPINDNKLDRLADKGDKRAIRLLSLQASLPDSLQQYRWVSLLQVFGKCVAADNFSERLVSWLVSIGISAPIPTLRTVSVIIITLILSYFTLVFGELVPKRIAMRKAEPLALFMSGPVVFIAKHFSRLWCGF